MRKHHIPGLTAAGVQAYHIGRHMETPTPFPDALPTKPVEVDKNGVPVDQNDWTETDWMDLHSTIKRLQKRIAARHRIKT